MTVVSLSMTLSKLGTALALWFALGLSLLPQAVSADELFGGRTALVMVDDAGCVYCVKWEREVKAGYEASPEGRFAPLEKWRIGSRELSQLGRLSYTPTFVLIVRGQEAGRIIGYAGADFFWAEVDRLYAKAGFQPEPVIAPPIEKRADANATMGLSIR
jgi:hypothetical protein